MTVYLEPQFAEPQPGVFTLAITITNSLFPGQWTSVAVLKEHTKEEAMADAARQVTAMARCLDAKVHIR